MNQRVSNEMLINKNNERETNAGALAVHLMKKKNFVCSN